MIVVDASWVIALRDPADPHHGAAVEINDDTVDEVALLHPVTMAECLVSAATLGALAEAAAALRAAYVIAEVDVDAPLRWAQLRAQAGLRLPDAIVLDTAQVNGAGAIATFDDQLARAARTRGVAVPSGRNGA